ncbi:MAG TPA: NUDIX domain-containing protein [Longimicrobium sp.]|jgi:ADP-ribose pyrophosphatase YjhB (NUDIX family)
MPISPYLRELRARAGPARLVLPSATAIVYGAAGELLLVRQRDGGVWSTPGGTVEPDERPADAAAREAWEETGLVVEPVRVLAVYGGPGFVVRYPSGDEAQYVMTVFECAVRGGALRPDGRETLEARFWSEAGAAALPLAAWLRPVLPTLFARPGATHFHPASWTPPPGD